ncbi:MAG TPA: hypothetical protein VH914_19410 [Acidimicrobiia bacterium]|jgi:hypothetical protein|nr:hypothetical protein [Acidimicrobiia bacterium]
MNQRPFRSRVSIACVLATAALVAPLAACSHSTPRSVTAFCNTLAQQKQQFLSEYDTSGQDPLQGFVTGMSSLGEIPVIFDRLDKVAPPDIEPDVAAVRDSFKQQLGSVSGMASNPLGGLIGGIASSLTAAGPFQRVSDYVTANCPDPSSQP